MTMSVIELLGTLSPAGMQGFWLIRLKSYQETRLYETASFIEKVLKMLKKHYY
jgi:hypothetical protein